MIKADSVVATILQMAEPSPPPSAKEVLANLDRLIDAFAVDRRCLPGIIRVGSEAYPAVIQAARQLGLLATNHRGEFTYRGILIRDHVVSRA